MTEVLKDYEVLRAQLNNVLDLLLPVPGQELLPLHGQDWPALKDQVIGWIAEGLQGQHIAVVRIRDSKHRLRYGAGYSARIS